MEVRGHDTVVIDRDGDVLLNFTFREVQVGDQAGIVHAGRGGDIAGGEGHKHVAGAVEVGTAGTTRTNHGNDNIRAGFMHRVIGLGKLEGTGTADGAAINAGQVLMAVAIVGGKAAANDDLLIRHIRGITRDGVFLNGNGAYETIGTVAEIDGRIHRAIGIQAGNPVASYAAGEGEFATEDNAVVGLDTDAEHGVVGTYAGVKGTVHGTVGVQARHMR